MSRSINLRKTITNQIIDNMIQGSMPSPMPSQTTLAEFYDVSRTTIRSIIQRLEDKGIIIYQDKQYFIKKIPQETDKYQSIPITHNHAPEDIVENYLNNEINNKRINPGDTFTVSQIVRDTGRSSKDIHEQLIFFSRFKLIKNIEHGIWQMNKIDKNYVEKLYELRILIETYSLKKFMMLPANDTRWSEAKLLLEQHRKFDRTIANNYREFSKLDRMFHQLLLSASENIFMEEYFEAISLIFHLQYQWDDTDLCNRNQIAISEHISILGKMINSNYAEAKDELEHHLKTARRSFENSIIVKI